MASAADFQAIRSSGVAIHSAKIYYGKLYLRQILSGSGMNQSDVTDTNAATGLGQTAVNNWGIYDGVGSGAELVAYGQGMHTFAGNWQNWFTMVFEIQRFKGSTLQIMGASLDKSNEWAIVGGTGNFAMANGVIKRTEYKVTVDEKIHELTINGYCHMDLPPVPTPTKAGPWGAAGGSYREMQGKSQRLESVTIRHYVIMESISFSYFNEDGQIRTAGPWGGSSIAESKVTTINFGPSEFVKETTWGITAGVPQYLTDFKIVTNVATYGPFGTLKPNQMLNFTVPKDKIVVGFFASAGTFVNSVGAFLNTI